MKPLDDPQFLYLTERDVVRAVGQDSAIASLREMLQSLGREEARNVPKTFATWGEGSSMHALGSLMPQRGYLGFKTWANTRTGGAAIFSLFDGLSGNLLALMEARALGQLRTSAIAGVATDLLAERSADHMAIIGTGAQSMMQVASVAAVRPLRSLSVFSPTPEKRRAFINRVRELFTFEVREANCVEDATAGAQIVTLITRAKEPFLHASQLAPQAHLNAVGSILPGSAEFAQDLFDVAAAVVVDDLENARRGSRELRERFGTGEGGWEPVLTLAACIRDGFERRGSGPTIFKGMGMGLSDLAIAAKAYEHARSTGIGLAMNRPEKLDVLQTWKQFAQEAQQ